MALGIVTIPADLPYQAIIVTLFELLGILGQIVAHYAADPATLPEDVLSTLSTLTATSQALEASIKSQTTAPAPTIDPVAVAADITAISTQFQTAIQNLQTKYNVTPSSSAATTTTTPTAPSAPQTSSQILDFRALLFPLIFWG